MQVDQIRLRSKASVAVIMLVIILAVVTGWRLRATQADSAVAMPNTFTVTNVADNGPGSLRDAIEQANTAPGADFIDFEDELSGTIALTTGELLITDDLTINGPSVFLITVSGNHDSRVFEIAASLTVTISGLTISDGNAAGGGGILNHGALTLTNIVLSGNSAGSGGGISNAGGALTLTNSTLSGNTASGLGGGIATDSLTSISFTTLSGNTGGGGGGIASSGGTLTLTNSTLSGNTGGAAGGGGIRNSGGTLNISFTTLSNNSASGSGGGIFNMAGTVNIKNSIVANSPSGGNYSGTASPSGINYSTDNSSASFTQVTPAQLNLGPLQDNGGNTQTHALLPGSVAIDAATDCTDTGGNPVSTDQRGVGRPQGAACDAGSFEFVPCTAPPTIICPEDFSVSTDPGKCSAAVDFALPSADCPCSSGGSSAPSRNRVGVKKPVSPVDEACSVTCSPPPGATFPRGTSSVTCTVTDAFGNTAQCSFNITVSDMTPPILSCPASVTQGTDPNQCMAVVTYKVTATDGCEGPITPVCTPPSGSTFQKGTSTVTCTATDSLNNQSNCSFPVTVNDTQPPQIVCPANISQPNDPKQCGAVVTYPPPTASDNCPNVGTPTCSPASGSFFQAGTTTVTCMVKDASNNPASCTFTVTVVDTVPPQITCPADITAKTPQAGNSCVPVTYTTPTATDNCPLPPNPVVCVPPSGSCFPRGTTTVTCTATDVAGNTASCSFRVTVFDICLQDDNNPSTVVLVNSAAGDYRFCCNGTVFTGKGKMTIRGNVYTLEHNPADRRVLVTDDESAHKGNASLQIPIGTIRCTILDRDTRNNSCICP